MNSNEEQQIYTYDKVRKAISNKVTDYDDDIVLDFASKLIIEEQPKKRSNRCKKNKKSS